MNKLGRVSIWLSGAALILILGASPAQAQASGTPIPDVVTSVPEPSTFLGASLVVAPMGLGYAWRRR
jgi:hypothetical protein